LPAQYVCVCLGQNSIVVDADRSWQHVLFRYRFPGYPTQVVGHEALMALYAGYRENLVLHGADALVVNIFHTRGVVILEYEVQGNAVGSGKVYKNRFISVVTIKDRKTVGWRDYMTRSRRCLHLPSVPSLSHRRGSH
jgi:ketosteroid isomerase-like protein